MVDTEYKFLWVNVESSGSSSDAQIFNHSKLRSPPEPLVPAGLNVHYFLMGDDAFALIALKFYSRRQLTREERLANYRISRDRRVVDNAIIILVSRFRIFLTTMEQSPRVVRNIGLTCDGITQHAGKT